MSKQFLKIRNGTSYPGLSADPSDPANGDLYYNTTSNVFRQYLNGAWSNVGSSSTTGTVTSVAMSVPSFLSVSGSPITSSGTLGVTYSGTALPVANGGTGTTTSTGSVNVVLSNSPTLSAPAITSTWTLTSAGSLIDSSDSTKVLNFSLSGMTTGETLTLSSSQSTTETLTIPNITASDTLSTLGLAQTFSKVNTFSSATASTTTSTGAVVISAGGLGVSGSINAGGQVKAAQLVAGSTTPSASTVFDAVIASGVAGDILTTAISGVASAFVIANTIGNSLSHTFFGGSGTYANTPIFTIQNSGEVTTADGNILDDGSGNVTIVSLAGTGTRAVVASAAGLLSAPVSDARLKKNVINLDQSLPAIETLNKLRPVAFNWDTSQKRVFDYGDQQEIGFIAQEIEKVVPQVVCSSKDGYLSVAYEKLVPLLIDAIKELNKKIDELSAQVNR